VCSVNKGGVIGVRASMQASHVGGIRRTIPYGSQHDQSRKWYWTSNTDFRRVDQRAFIMGDVQGAVPDAVPEELSHLIHLNHACRGLICVACRQEVQPRALARHLKRKHEVARHIRKQVEKYEQFISGASCRRVHLDHELDGRTDRLRCEEREVKCDACVEEEREAAHIAALQCAYIAEQESEARREQDRMLDSGIDMPSSVQAGGIASSPPPYPPTESSPGRVTARDDPATGSSTSPVDHSSRSPGPWSEGLIPQWPEAVIPIDRSPSKSPAASAASSDPGFLTDITLTDRFEFQSQQRQQEADQAKTRAQVRGESQAVAELEGQFERWVGQCPLCVIRGGAQGGRHSISECQQEDAGKVRGE
jgi:hypothetical protein